MHVYRLKNARLRTNIMRIDPNQVHLAPFWLKLIRFGSYRVWDACGMPPGL